MLNEAEMVLDNVLRFYESKKIFLNYRPRIQVIDGLCPEIPLSMGEVRGEKDFLLTGTEYLITAFGRTIYKESYGLIVSNEAIREASCCAFRIANAKIMQLTDVKNDRFANCDIILWGKNPKLQIQLEEVLAHEVWHLIDEEYGLASVAPLAFEAVAYWVGRKKVGRTFPKGPEAVVGIAELFTIGAAGIVELCLLEDKNPYQTLLQKDRRLEIQEEIVKRIEPVLVQKIEAFIKTTEGKAAMKAQMEQEMDIPAVQKLRGNLTPRNIIKLFQEIGAYTLAKELEEQDLSRMMNWYRLVGFN